MSVAIEKCGTSVNNVAIATVIHKSKIIKGTIQSLLRDQRCNLYTLPSSCSQTKRMKPNLNHCLYILYYTYVAQFIYIYIYIYIYSNNVTLSKAFLKVKQ